MEKLTGSALLRRFVDANADTGNVELELEQASEVVVLIEQLVAERDAQYTKGQQFASALLAAQTEVERLRTVINNMSDLNRRLRNRRHKAWVRYRDLLQGQVS